jgi:hypothetical protein
VSVILSFLEKIMLIGLIGVTGVYWFSSLILDAAEPAGVFRSVLVVADGVFLVAVGVGFFRATRKLVGLTNGANG